MIFNNKSNISKQVVNEIINILLKKYQLPPTQIINVINELNDNLNIYDFGILTQKLALNIQSQYKLQFYDSLIIATALENNCTILYTEDMQYNQVIKNKLKIINPFI